MSEYSSNSRSLGLSENAFRQEWEGVRRSAVLPFVSEWLQKVAPIVSPRDHPEKYSDNEWKMISQVSEEKQDELLRKVFKTCRKYGEHLRSKNGDEAPETIVRYLSRAEIPCATGEWKSDPSNPSHPNEVSLSLNRSGCHQAGKSNKFWCNYWREAINGVLMGLDVTGRYVQVDTADQPDGKCLGRVYFQKKND